MADTRGQSMTLGSDRHAEALLTVQGLEWGSLARSQGILSQRHRPLGARARRLQAGNDPRRLVFTHGRLVQRHRCRLRIAGKCRPGIGRRRLCCGRWSCGATTTLTAGGRPRRGGVGCRSRGRRQWTDDDAGVGTSSIVLPTSMTSTSINRSWRRVAASSVHPSTSVRCTHER